MGDIPQASVIDTRSDQMFPTLTAEEIDRLCRFGQPLSFKAGEAIVRVGETGPGIALVLSGEIEATQRDQAGHTRVIVTHKRGNFMGELAQLYTNSPSRFEAELPSERTPGEIEHHFVAVTNDSKVETLVQHIGAADGLDRKSVV